MLMHANDRRVDHLHSGIVGLGQCAHEPGPHARPSPANEAIVAGRIRTKLSGRSRHGAPDRKTQKMPLRTRRSFTRGTLRGLLGVASPVPANVLGTICVPIIGGGQGGSALRRHDAQAPLLQPAILEMLDCLINVDPMMLRPLEYRQGGSRKGWVAERANRDAD